MEYAVVVNNVVSNVVVASAPPVGGIRIDNLNPVPGIGWGYLNGVFSPPAYPGTQPASPLSPVFSKVSFLQLFTSAEAIALVNFASNTSLSTATIQQIAVFQQFFNAADTIDMTNAITIQGLELLESAGIIGTGRAAQILASRN